MKTSIYFVAILPEQEIRQEITAFKNIAKEKFETERALTSPPHITVIPPFKMEENKIDEVKKLLDSYSKTSETFEIELKNFNCFAPRVIYVDVIDNHVLNQSYFELNTALENKIGIPFQFKERDYHPHMTVAFKDLKENKFPLAWAYFRKEEYRRLFEAQSLTLLKHNRKEWVILDDFFFSS